MSIKRQKKKRLHSVTFEPNTCTERCMNAHIYLEYLVQFIDYPLEAGELMCLENMAPKTFQRSHQNLHCPICNAQNHFTKFTLLLCNKNSERMLVSKLIHKADTWNFNFHNRSHQNKMWEIKNTLSVYSESHTSYHYSSIYYIEIIQVLYC